MSSYSFQEDDRKGGESSGNSFFGNIFGPYYKLLGIEYRVIPQMTYEERAGLSRVLFISILLLLFVLVSFFIILNSFSGKIWQSIFICYIIFGAYLLLAGTFISSYLNRGQRSSFSLRDQVFSRSGIQRIGIFLFLLVGAIGLSMIMSKDQIKEKYKSKVYEFQNGLYVSELKKSNKLAEPQLKEEREDFVNAYLNYLSKAGPRNRARIDSINEVLDKKINKNIIDLNTTYSKKGGTNNFDATYDSIMAGKQDIGYSVNISPGFIEKKSDTVFEINGIRYVRFDSDKDIEIREDFNDSIYQTIQKTIFLKAVRDKLSDTLLIHLNINTGHRDSFPGVNPAIPTENFASATRIWLKNLIAVDTKEMSVGNELTYYTRLLVNGNENVLYRAIILVLTVSFLYLYLLMLLENLRKSSYPRLLMLYRKSRAIKFDEYTGKLDEKETILTEFANTAEDGFTPEERMALRMIKDDGSFDSYMGYAKFYQQRKEYKKAIQWLEDGFAKYNQRPEYRKRSLEFLKSMADVYQDMREKQKSNAKLDEYENAFNALTVVENLGRKLSVDQFEISNHYFYKDIRWKLQPGINVLLGKNGYGKSHLISIFLAILQNNSAQAKSMISGSDPYSRSSDSKLMIKMKEDRVVKLTKEQELIINKKIEEVTEKIRSEQLANADKGYGYEKEEFEELLKSAIENEREGFIKKLDEEKMLVQYVSDPDTGEYAITGEFGKIPVLAIPDTRFIDKSTNQISKNSNEIDIAKDGAWHFIYQVSYSSVIENFYLEACIEIYEKRQNAFGLETENTPAVELIKDIYKKLTGITITKLEVTKPSPGVYEMYVTTDDLVDKLPIQKVSQGTFSVISIVGIILTYLKFIYQDKVTPDQFKKQKAIVIIDEIDAHLHPSWQQKMINILRDTFPNVQFIITAHSPFIVAGCSEMEVSLLQKDADSKKYFLTQFNQHFIGYSPDELCKVIFDIEKYDENFFTYINQTPRKKELEEQINILKQKNSSDPDIKTQLEQLHYELYRILKAESRLKDQYSTTSK